MRKKKKKPNQNKHLLENGIDRINYPSVWGNCDLFTPTPYNRNYFHSLLFGQLGLILILFIEELIKSGFTKENVGPLAQSESYIFQC